MFGGAATGAGATPDGRPDADHVFADAFEEVSFTRYSAHQRTPDFETPSSFDQRLNDTHHGGRGRELSAALASDLSLAMCRVLWLGRMPATNWEVSGMRRARASLQCSLNSVGTRKLRLVLLIHGNDSELIANMNYCRYFELWL